MANYRKIFVDKVKRTDGRRLIFHLRSTGKSGRKSLRERMILGFK